MVATKEATQTVYTVPPVERALHLLRYIANGNRCRNLSKASKELKINRTTLIRLIHTLLAERMIEEMDDEAGYRLGPGLISLSAQAIHSRDIVQVTHPILVNLVAELNLSAHLGILDGTDIVYLSRETPNAHLVSNVRAGSRLPAHATSIGRVILAEYSPEDIRLLYDHQSLEGITEKTSTTIGDLIAQTQADKQLGFAWSEGNFEGGIGSCAAVILDHKGKPVGGLNVSGPEDRFTASTEDARHIQKMVVQSARDASSALGYAGTRFS